MRRAVAIARKDLRQRLRDRSAIVIGVVAPVLIAGLMSLAFHGVETFHFTLGLVDDDHGPVAAGLAKTLARTLRQVVTVRRVPTASAAAREVRDGHLGAALVVPAGFSASVAGSGPQALTTLASTGNVIAGEVTASVASSFVAQVNADRLSLATALATAGPAGPASTGGASPAAVPSSSALAAMVAKLRLPVQAVQRPIGAHELKVISYYAPGMAIFFLLFTVSYASRSFFVDRSQGMIDRMRAAPVRPAEILAGKVLSVLVYGCVSLGVIAVVTSAVFGADWGAPGPAALVGVALVLAVVCLTALVIGVCRTQRQAEGVSAVIVFGLALLGGNFFFISAAPSAMKRLALLTPNGWALRAFTDLSMVGGGVGTVVQPVLAILAFAAVVGTVALLLARRAVSA
ncbi:MAG TPA: ABC transporter permease [Acidimicrobiales bacterium]|nr:ABC transporter permease [Acidimicrobiales bacterium]